MLGFPRLSDSEIKPVRDLRHMCDTLRILSRAIGEYESRSHTEATETAYAARLIDVMGRIYAPVASKPGSTGGTLSQALSSRCTLKQFRDPDAQLTWREIMETCIRFADENAAQQPVTSMLVNSPPPAKDKPSGGGQGKPGGKPGGQAGKPGVFALATSLLPMVPPQACVFTTALKGRATRNSPSVRRIKRMLILLHAPGMASCLQSSPRGLHVGSQIARMVSSASSSMVMGLTKWPRNMAAYQPRAHLLRPPLWRLPLLPVTHQLASNRPVTHQLASPRANWVPS